jgi:hypothetical protein
MTFPILLEIEDPALASVIRLLNKFPGVARIHFDLDNLAGPRGKMPGVPRKQANPDLPAIQDVIIAFLIQGPKSNDEIKQELIRVGHEGTARQVSDTLTTLRNKGITESGGRRIHQLTAMAREKLGAHAAPAPAALPSPEPKRRPIRSNAVVEAHQAMLKLHPSPVSPVELGKLLDTTTKNASNDLYRLKQAGLVKRISKGRYGLTKKGTETAPQSPATKD